MMQLDIEHEQTQQSIKQLEMATAIVSDMNNLASFDSIEKVHNRVMALVDEIRAEGVSSTDIRELTKLNVLVGAVESEYSACRCNFNQLVVTCEAEKNAKEMLIKGLFAVLAAAIAYLTGKVFGFLFGGGGSSSGGSGGGVAARVDARNITHFMAIKESDAEKLAKVFKSGDVQYWMVLNRIIVVERCAELSGVAIESVSKCLETARERIAVFDSEEAFRKEFGNKTPDEFYGSSGMAEHYKKVVTECTPSLVAAFGDNKELKDAANSPANLAAGIVKGDIVLEFPKDDKIAGKVAMDAFIRDISKDQKTVSKFLDQLAFDCEYLKNSAHIASLENVVASQFITREIVHPMNFCNKFITKTVIPTYSYMSTILGRLDGIYNRLAKSFNRAVKSLTKEEVETLTAVWEDPEHGEVDFKELQKALKSVSNTPEVNDCLEKVNLLLEIKLG